LKERLKKELIELAVDFTYLAVFFGAFTWFRRLILAQQGIGYAHYGIAIIEALVLAKIVNIGDLLHLGRRFDDKPLIYPTLYKTFVFTLWVAVFKLLEKTIAGLLFGKGLAQGYEEMLQTGGYELVARCLIVFFAFIPFFAMKELDKVLGQDRMKRLFFVSRSG
jgi:hypothetical protein